MTQIITYPPSLPAGTNTQVQFNNSGVFGANSSFTFNSGTNTLNTGYILAGGWLLGGGVLETEVTGLGLAVSTISTTGTDASGPISFNTGSSVNGNSGDITFDTSLPSGSGLRGNVRLQGVAYPIPVAGDNSKIFSYNHTGLKFELVTPSGGSQTPWVQNVNADGFNLNNVPVITNSGALELQGQNTILVNPWCVGLSDYVGLSITTTIVSDNAHTNIVSNATGAKTIVIGDEGFVNAQFANSEVVVKSNGTKKLEISDAGVGFFAASPAAQGANIADPSGGVVQDTEARTAISSVISLLESFGFSASS